MMKGIIQNRNVFLNNIAARLGREKPNTKVERPKWTYHPQDTVLQGTSSDELLEILKKQCSLILTNIVIAKKAELIDTVKAIVDEYGGGPVVAWKDSRFEDYGLSPLFNSIWPQENIKFYEWDYAAGKDNIINAEKANIGITISDITLAESGTAVLFSSKDKGRTVSFLPEKSVIIIPKSTIVPRLTQAVRIISERMNQGEHIASCINFITGPSNSADIESKLVVGVHGPVKVTYIVAEDL